MAALAEAPGDYLVARSVTALLSNLASMLQVANMPMPYNKQACSA